MKSIEEIADQLRAPFAKEVISWRAQSISVKENGASALALAYIDARDVMNRLDDVCGVGGWQCKYPIANGKTICEIGIKCGDEWIWKADGAGDTDVEAEKGAISDAFKRAAVKWGIGRYLYDFDATWISCEVDKRGDKYYFKRWIGDPWAKVKPAQKSGFETAKKQNGKWEAIADEMRVCESADELRNTWDKYEMELQMFRRSDKEIFDQLVTIKDNVKMELAMKAGMPQGFNEIGRAQ